MIYHLILDGEIVPGKTRDFADEAPTLAPNKGVWLPEVVEGEDFDPISEVREGPVTTVEAERVLVAYTVRPRNEAEVAAMADVKVSGLEAEYLRRSRLPYEAEVDGVVRTWHGDDEGQNNIRDVLLGIVLGVVPDPRPWKPFGESLVNVSHAGFAAIKLAHAVRKDALFVTLQSLKAAVRAMTDPADVYAFDPLAGWGD